MWRRARAASGTEAGQRAESIVAEISAEQVDGQIAVGSHNVQIHADHGAVVYALASGQAPSVRARTLPVVLRPRDFPQLLGRERELDELRALLAAGRSVGLVAPAGGGKTSVLRRLAHLSADAFADGIVFLRAAGQPRADVERFLFDAFYACDAPYQPTPFELRARLAERRALVVLDDLDQPRDDVCELLDSAPDCRFVLASERRELWGEERTLELDGLDDDTALTLLERELGRPLRDDERPRAQDLCRRLGGRPLALLQAAALARGGELPLGAPGELEGALRAGLDDEERRVLHALELLAPAAVHVDDVAAIAAVPDAAEVLERLRARGAAQAHSPRWSVTLTVGRAADDDGDGDDERALLLRRARERLADGASRRPLEDVPAILAALCAGIHGDGGPASRRDLIALARAVDPLLAGSGRWGAWAVALERACAAAEAIGDRAAAAWALHQLGTRAGCLGERAGVAQLQRALALRRELGDEVGAAVSAHNLAQLFGAPPRTPTPRPRPGRWLALGGGVLALGVAAAVALGGHGSSPGLAHSADTQAQTTITQPTDTDGGSGGGGSGGSHDNGGGPSPTGGVQLSIDGERAFEADPDGLVQHAFDIGNLGPTPLAIEPSVEGAAFRIGGVDCVEPLPVDTSAACTVLVDYTVADQPASATLRFKGSSSTAQLSGAGRAQPTTTETQPAPATTATTATATTTTAVGSDVIR